MPSKDRQDLTIFTYIYVSLIFFIIGARIAWPPAANYKSEYETQVQETITRMVKSSALKSANQKDK